MTFILVIGEASHWGHKDSLSRNPNSLLLEVLVSRNSLEAAQTHREEVPRLWCRRTLLERAWQWEPNLASLKGLCGKQDIGFSPWSSREEVQTLGHYSWLLCSQNIFLWSSSFHFTLVLFIGSTASEHLLNICSPGLHSCLSALLYADCLSVWSPLSSHW